MGVGVNLICTETEFLGTRRVSEDACMIYIYIHTYIIHLPIFTIKKTKQM